MDIQSSILNAIFALFPVHVPGWVSPIKPSKPAHGGIPLSLYNDKKNLLVMVDPWSELQRPNQLMEAFDSVALYVNDAPAPVAGAIVQPGDEQKRISLIVSYGHLIHGLNRLYYKVTRLSGNVETSRDLLVLYHLRAPANLDLVIPPDVLTKGVSAARAAQGVVFGFTYNTAQAYDLVRLRIGNESFTKEVTDPPTPLTITLFTADFLKVGDGKIAVDFLVTDQLGNVATSGTKTLDVHVARLDLQPPTVIGQNGNNFSPTQTQIRMLVPTGPLLSTDQLTVAWTGATSVAAGSYTSPPRAVSAGLEIAVPRSVLAYSLGQTVSVTYTIIRDGIATTSPVLLLNILVLPAAALITPKIIEADANNVLDVVALGSKNATIHGLLWTLIEVGQQVWLTLEGKKADGSAHNLTVWNGGGNFVNATWVSQGFWPRTFANSYLKQLGDGSTLTLRFKAALDQSNIEARAVVFPVRTYTIRSVAQLAPTIDSVKDLSGWEIADNGYTVHNSVTVSGTAPAGQEVEVFVGTVSKDKVKAGADGSWNLRLTGLALDVLHSIKAIGQYGSHPSSNVRRLTSVFGQRPAITAAHDSKGQPITNGGSTPDTTVRLTGTANSFLEVEIFDGTTSTGKKATTDAKGVWMVELTGLTTTEHLFKAKALYGSGTESGVWTLTVNALAAPTITSVKDQSNWNIPDNGYTVHTSVTVSGTAPAGQEVEVFLDAASKGKVKAATNSIWTLTLGGLALNVLHTIKAVGQYADKPPSNLWRLTALNGVTPAITAAHDSKNAAIANGGTTSDTSIKLSGTANTFLEVEIFDGTTSKGKVKADVSGKWTFTVTGLTASKHEFTAKALYGSSTVSAVWTIIVGQELTPTITSVKGLPSGVEIADGSTTIETAITVSGAANKGLQVEVFDGTVSKGKATADASTGIWTLPISSLTPAAHSLRAKALYGAGASSGARTFTVRIAYRDFTPFTGNNWNGWGQTGGYLQFAAEGSNVFLRNTAPRNAWDALIGYAAKLFSDLPAGGQYKVSLKYRCINSSGKSPSQSYVRCYWYDTQDPTTFNLIQNGAWNTFSRTLSRSTSKYLIIHLFVGFSTPLPGGETVHLDIDDFLIEEV
ncbi:hypothetical protein [Pseudomonas syringae]|uniref:hypothetical protein n=1 Tax=Pseudomonas syringae TaxID=317 RepID=UPI001F267DF0|nr:hypothetical protein [Pseudomonas syringae]MCF5702647.1 hypothetical protein [Pseudomonas syringae]